MKKFCEEDNSSGRVTFSQVQNLPLLLSKGYPIMLC